MDFDREAWLRRLAMMHWRLDELRSGECWQTYEELGSQMKEITVLTTFHQPGLEKYGQRMIDSFAEKSRS